MGGSRINKACDGCRYRKVKCNGANPCSQCAHLDLQCVFSPPTAKRKPGVRGRLVAQLRQKNGVDGSGSVNGAAPERNGTPSTDSLSWGPNPGQMGGGAPLFQQPPPPVTSVAGIINYMDTSPTAPMSHGYGSGHPRPDMGPPRQPSFSADPTFAAGPGPSPYPPTFFLNLVPDFENLVYPVNPVITPDEIRAAVTTMDTNFEDAALVYAFAAVTINLTQTSWHLNGDVAAQMTDLMQRSLEAHRRADIALVTSDLTITTNNSSASSPPDPSAPAMVTKPAIIMGDLPVTVKRAMTCIFLEISFMAFKLFDRSFTILREAISLTLTLKIHAHTPDDPHLDRREVARRQRLYWECFIHERFVNVMSGFPCTLVPLRTGLPYADLSIPANVDLGFRRLIRLFMIMDDEFFTHWNADLLPVHARQQQQQHPHVVTSPIATAASPASVASSNTINPHEMSAEWIERKQAELDEDEADTVRAVASSTTGLTELQHADLYITRLWMRTLVWQLALSRGLLRSLPPEQDSHQQHHHHSHHYRHKHHQGLSLHYPAARLSHQLRTLVSRLENVYSIGTHGSGILQKLFEITTTVADVLALPPDQSQDVKLRMEDFIFLVSFLLQFERMPKRERDYMREKVEVLQHMYTVVDFGDLADARST